VRCWIRTATLVALLATVAGGAWAAPSYDGLYGSNSLWDPCRQAGGPGSGDWAWNTAINTDAALWANYLGLDNVSNVQFMAFAIYTTDANRKSDGSFAFGPADLTPPKTQPDNWTWKVDAGGTGTDYAKPLIEVGSSSSADRVTVACTRFYLDPSKFQIEDPAYAIHVSWVGDPLAGTTNRSVWVGWHAAPEPASIVLLGAVGGVGVLVRKRRRRNAE
jgi:hypothetical protein